MASIINPKEKELQFKINIRIFGESDSYMHSHCYLVDDMPIGLSPPIGQLVIDIRTHTLQQLRPMIEYRRKGQMNVRSLMFQEALFIMNRLPNIYNRSKEDLINYSFGFVLKDGGDVKLIHPDRETEFISELIGATDFFSYDLILIPWSQIPPTYQTKPSENKQTKQKEELYEEEEEELNM